MFFILSKLLVFLLRPLIWVLLVLGYGLLTRQPGRRRRSLWTALILLILFTNRPLFNLAVQWWELETLTADRITEPYDIGILLGGYTNLNLRPAHDRYNISERGNRLINTLELYHRGKIRKILLSGGSGRLWGNEPSESEEAAIFLQTMGVPQADILIEPDSRSTWENALYTRNLVGQRYPEARCLLITSAWHMRRARLCFRKAGLTATPYSVDHLTEAVRWSPDWWLLPNSNALSLWELLIKEWVGYLVYLLK